MSADEVQSSDPMGETARCVSFALLLPAPFQHADHESFSRAVASKLEGGSNSATPQEVLDTVGFLIQLFLAENFTGRLSEEEWRLFEHLFVALNGYSRNARRPGKTAAARRDPETREKHQRQLHMLSVDGEVANPSVEFPGFLLVSIALVDFLQSSGPATMRMRCLQWKLRTLFLHQLCVTHRCHSLFAKSKACIASIVNLHAGRDSDEKRAASSPFAGLYVEAALVLQYYSQFDAATDALQRAMKLTGLTVEEGSMMGVRTRWQQNPMPQSVLVASSQLDSVQSEPVTDASTGNATPLPAVIMPFAQGHDLYDRPVTQNPSDAAVLTAPPPALVAEETLTPLRPVDQAIVLAWCSGVKADTAPSEITRHSVQVYVERLLVDPAPPVWVLRAQALLLRSYLERNRSRVQERAFLQTQELMDQFNDAVRYGPAETDPATADQPTTPVAAGAVSHPELGTPGQEERRPYRGTLRFRAEPEAFFLARWPSIWDLKSTFAEMCFEDNLFKTALEIFEDVQNWEAVIRCCSKLDRRRKAETIVRERLEEEPNNPVLWDALGMATRDEQYCLKAWELAEHKLAQPMRSLATLALEREKYKEVVEYFEAAVALNPVFGGDWFKLGFACMKLGQLDGAARAFTRVCQLDPDDSFGWTNLGSVLLRQGHKRAAFSALSQALRNNRNNWRMWQNYFSVGVELREVAECTNALTIALDIAERKYIVDDDVLQGYTSLLLAHLRTGEVGATTAEDERPKCPCAAFQLPGGSAEVEIRPLLEDIELDSDSSATVPSHPSGHNAEGKQASNLHHSLVQRVRTVFDRMFNLFSLNPTVCACCAQIFSQLDGPMEGYEFRVREIRAAQKPQWERTEELFARIVAAVDAMAREAHRVLHSGEPTTEATTENPRSNDTASSHRAVSANVHSTINSILHSARGHLARTEAYQKLTEIQRSVDQL